MTEQIVAARALNGAGGLNGHGLRDGGTDPPAMAGTRDASSGGRGAGAGTAGDRPAPRGLAAMLAADPELLAAVKRAVEETTASYADIGRRLGLPAGSINRYALRHGWRRPDSAAKPTRPRMSQLARTIDDGEAVTARLLRVVDRQIGNIDVHLRQRGAVIDEKDARLLVHLAKTLQTIMALGRDGGAGTKESAERDQVDADLARRIALWAEGREEA
jgi:hypothetical protein